MEEQTEKEKKEYSLLERISATSVKLMKYNDNEQSSCLDLNILKT